MGPRLRGDDSQCCVAKPPRIALRSMRATSFSHGQMCPCHCPGDRARRGFVRDPCRRAVLQRQDAHAAGQLRRRRQHRHRGAHPGAAPAEAHCRRPHHRDPEHAGRRWAACHEPARAQHQVARRRADRRLLHHQPDRTADRRPRAQDQDVGGLRGDRRRHRLDRRLWPQGHPARAAEAGRYRQGDEDPISAATAAAPRTTPASGWRSRS